MFLEQKKLFKKSEVNFINVNKYDELSVKQMFEDFKTDPKFMLYFSDEYPTAKGPNRQYFFNVLNTLEPLYLEKVIDHANRQRHTTEGEA